MIPTNEQYNRFVLLILKLILIIFGVLVILWAIKYTLV